MALRLRPGTGNLAGTRVASESVVGACSTGGKQQINNRFGGRTMWTKPDFTEMRFGFEITMYIGNR